MLHIGIIFYYYLNTIVVCATWSVHGGQDFFFTCMLVTHGLTKQLGLMFLEEAAGMVDVPVVVPLPLANKKPYRLHILGTKGGIALLLVHEGGILASMMNINQSGSHPGTSKRVARIILRGKSNRPPKGP